MRTIVVLEFVSLDGVMQAPGAPEEDTSGGFPYGGWTVPYELGRTMDEQMKVPFDLLLGRKTYDIFAPYWPAQRGTVADKFNAAKKYVVTNNDIALTWEESIRISGDIVEQIKALKQQDGPMLQVYGSSVLTHTLLQYDLVDELWLKIYPILLGMGKRAFVEGDAPAAFELIESRILPSGVIVASYQKSGSIRTGSFV